MLMAMMMRVGMRMLMNDDKDESWEDFSHARAWRSSADPLVDPIGPVIPL